MACVGDRCADGLGLDDLVGIRGDIGDIALGILGQAECRPSSAEISASVSVKDL
jgi:hypothetical protein